MTERASAQAPGAAAETLTPPKRPVAPAKGATQAPDLSPRLRQALSQPGFAPRRKDTPALLSFLDTPDKKLARAAERALAQLGAGAAQEALAQLPSAQGARRGRLCRVAGRVVSALQHETLAQALVPLLDDPDAKTRRSAAWALGKTRFSWVEQALLDRWRQHPDLPEQRALAEALGKAGGQGALQTLKQAVSDDPLLQQIVKKALAKLQRTLKRPGESTVVATVAARRPVTVVLHCRSGLEQLLIQELGQAAHPRPGSGKVRAVLHGPLEDLWRCRIALQFGFPLPPVTLRADGDRQQNAVEAVAQIVTSAKSKDLLSTWTRGQIRYRLHWAQAGHQRAATWQCAQRVTQLDPQLINDPRESTWEFVARVQGRRVSVELWPRSLKDPRFRYRKRDVPGASHPTIAAALALAAGVQEDDVVWDPFVGSATELIERGLLGPYGQLLGTDLEPSALDAARENLGASSLERWTVLEQDARTFTPTQPVSLILTNPPLGRRVLDRRALPPLLLTLLTRGARLLAPEGRLVWLSPVPRLTVKEAQALGLVLELRQQVDLGGFHAELQKWRKPRHWHPTPSA